MLKIVNGFVVSEPQMALILWWNQGSPLQTPAVNQQARERERSFLWAADHSCEKPETHSQVFLRASNGSRQNCQGVSGTGCATWCATTSFEDLDKSFDFSKSQFSLLENWYLFGRLSELKEIWSLACSECQCSHYAPPPFRQIHSEKGDYSTLVLKISQLGQGDSRHSGYYKLTPGLGGDSARRGIKCINGGTECGQEMTKFIGQEGYLVCSLG